MMWRGLAALTESSKAHRLSAPLALALKRATDDFTTTSTYLCFANSDLRCGGDQDGPKSLFLHMAQDMYQKMPERRRQFAKEAPESSRLKRRSAVGASATFDELNAIFEGVVLAIPDQEISQKCGHPRSKSNSQVSCVPESPLATWQ